MMNNRLAIKKEAQPPCLGGVEYWEQRLVMLRILKQKADVAFRI
jgi:hypothetical protein